MSQLSVAMKLVKEIGRRDILLALARHPNSDRLFVGSSDFKLYSFDFAHEKNEPTAEALAHDSYITGVARTESCIVTGGFDRRLVWWPVDGTQPLRTVEDAHQRFIRGVKATPDGKFIVSVGDDMVARVWESESGKLVHELRGHEAVTPHHYPSMLYACACSPDSQFLATVDRVGKIVVWRIADGQQIAQLEAPEMYTWDPKQRRHSIGGIRSVVFSPDGKLLAVGGMGQVGNIDHLEGKARVEIFDWQANQKTHSYNECSFKGLVESLIFHPSGLLIAAGGDSGGFVMFIDLADSKKTLRDEKAPMHIHEIALSETGDTLYAAGHNRLAKWSLT